MKICPHCGQPLDDDSQHCPMCNQAVGDQEPQEPEVTREVNTEEPSQPREIQLLKVLKQMSASRRFWMGAAYIVAALLMFYWGIKAVQKVMEPKKVVDHQSGIEEKLKSKLEAMVDELLAEKLEWARQIMRRRLPTRFPEELILDSNKASAEVKYSNKEKTSAYYEFEVCFHFKDDVEETYTWKPVVFYFEKREGQWVLVGEQWLRDTELMFE